MSDLLSVFSWWFITQIFGLIGFPVAFRVFRRLPDRGYGISKALGMLLTSYLFWLLGVLGFLRNDNAAMLFALTVTAIGSALFYYRMPHSETGATSSVTRHTLPSWFRDNWQLVLAIEVVFALSFGGWAVYRAYVPRIMTAGGEKFMELAFLNGIRRSETLPPLDPWLSGFAISYYYFGYLMMSILIRLSGVAPSVGFNIGGALLFALTATGAFSLIFNLVASHRPGRQIGPEPDDGENCTSNSGRMSTATRQLNMTWVGVALLGTVFVVLLGNFEAPLEVAHWKGLGTESVWRWLDIADLDNPPPDFGSDQSSARMTRPGWWWWRASRVIFDYDVADWPERYDKSAVPPPQRRENIDEFPSFSFVLGDMHPHVLALPFVMLALSVSLNLYHAGAATRRELRSSTFDVPGVHIIELVLFALIFGALGFLNTWDFPIQWAVAVGAYAVVRLSRESDGPSSVESTSRFSNVRPHLRPIVTLAGALALGGLLLYAPFYIGFQSQAGGPLPHVHSSTRLSQFLVMFGPLLFILVIFLVWCVRRARKDKQLDSQAGVRTTTTILLVALGFLVLTALAILAADSVRELVAPGLVDKEPIDVALRYLNMRLSTPWVTLLLSGMIGATVAVLVYSGFSSVAQFSLLLVMAGAMMALIPEYIYLKDVFGVRLNTIFKFYYQTWVLWAVAAAGAVYVLMATADGLQSTNRRLFGVGLAVVVSLGLVFPLLAIPDRAKEFPEAPTLDGTAYLAKEQAADYAAVQWLNANVKGAPVVLETPGGAYQYEGRVSVQTGLPTLLGWSGHEHQWRGNTVEQDKRLPAIQELCTTTDPERTLTLLHEYDITYVYVGPLERVKCPAGGLEKFDRLMETVYDRDGVTIYKRRDVLGSRSGE